METSDIINLYPMANKRCVHMGLIDKNGTVNIPAVRAAAGLQAGGLFDDLAERGINPVIALRRMEKLRKARNYTGLYKYVTTCYDVLETPIPELFLLLRLNSGLRELYLYKFVLHFRGLLREEKAARRQPEPCEGR